MSNRFVDDIITGIRFVDAEKSGPVNPTIKSLTGRIKFIQNWYRKAACQPGQTAASTGCTPASGEGGGGPSSETEETPEAKAKKIKGKLLAGEPLTAQDLAEAPKVLKKINTHNLAKLTQKVTGSIPQNINGVAKDVYIAAMLAVAKKGDMPTPSPSATPAPVAESVPEVPESLPTNYEPQNQVTVSGGPDPKAIKKKIIAGQALSADELQNFPQLMKSSFNTHQIADMLKKVMGSIPDAPKGKGKDVYIAEILKINAQLTQAAGGQGPAPAAETPTKKEKPKWPSPMAVAQKLSSDAELRKQVVAAAMVALGIASKEGELTPDDRLKIRKKIKKEYGNLAFLTNGEVDAAFTALKNSPKPPEPGFTGKDASGHCWENGTMVPCKEEAKKAEWPTGDLHAIQNEESLQQDAVAAAMSELGIPLQDYSETENYEKITMAIFNHYGHQVVLNPKQIGEAVAALKQEQPAANEPTDTGTPKELENFPASPADLSEVKQLPGSTGAKLMKDANGNEFVVKKGNSPDHVKEEFAADRLYEVMGFDVPAGKMYDENGVPIKVTAYLKDSLDLKEAAAGMSTAKKQELYKKISEGFVADCLLGNWDAIGMAFDNIRVGKDGKIYRIDNGGSLRYRAQGKLKTGNAWKEQVTELQTMRDPYKNPQAAEVYAGITDKDIQDQVEKLWARKGKILETAPASVRGMLEARLNWLKNNYGKPDPNKPKKSTVPNSIYGGKGADWPSTPPDPNNSYIPKPEEANNRIFKQYGDTDVRAPVPASAYAPSFVKHMSDTIAKLTPKQKKWVKDYIDEYSHFNALHRQCPETLNCLDPENKEKAKAIDEAIAKAGKFEKPVTVWRNTGLSINDKVGKDFLEAIQAAVETGDEVRIPSVKSAAMTPEVSMGSTSDGIKLEIRAKSGLWIEGISGHGHGEAELIQGHNVRYRAIAIKDVKDLPGSSFPWGTKKLVILEEI